MSLRLPILHTRIFLCKSSSRVVHATLTIYVVCSVAVYGGLSWVCVYCLLASAVRWLLPAAASILLLCCALHTCELALLDVQYIYIYISRVCSVPYVPRRTGGIYRRCHWYRTLRQVRYGVNTGTGNFGKFGTTSIPVPAVPVQTFVPVPDTSVSSVRRQYRYRKLR